MYEVRTYVQLLFSSSLFLYVYIALAGRFNAISIFRVLMWISNGNISIYDIPGHNERSIHLFGQTRRALRRSSVWLLSSTNLYVIITLSTKKTDGRQSVSHTQSTHRQNKKKNCEQREPAATSASWRHRVVAVFHAHPPLYISGIGAAVRSAFFCMPKIRHTAKKKNIKKR